MRTGVCALLKSLTIRFHVLTCSIACHQNRINSSGVFFWAIGSDYRLDCSYSNFDNMPGRTRPIDKLATAVGKCSKEVCILHEDHILFSYAFRLPCCICITLYTNPIRCPECGIRQMHLRRLQQRAQRHVRQRIHAAEGMLPRKCYLLLELIKGKGGGVDG